MPKGFGQPNFWLQLMWSDEFDDHEKWLPIYGNRAEASRVADVLMTTRNLDRILLLDGKVRKGGVPTSKQMLADWVPPGSPEAETAQVRYVYK